MLYSLSVLYIFAVDYLGIDKLLVQFPAQLRLFLVGIFLYVLFDKFKDKSITLFAIVSLIFIVSGFLIFWSFDSDQNKKHFYIKRFFRIFPLYAFLKVLQTLPFDFSYSFYILHFPVIQLALYFGINPSNPLVSFVSLFAVILFLSYFSEKYIEKRFVKIGKEID